MPEGSEPSPKKCFIAMPITTTDVQTEQYGGDGDHWLHVMDVVFKPAIEAAGYEAVSPFAPGADMIHARIIEQLERADMVLVDVSSLNPNVMFELGVRTSLDLPVAVVAERGTNLPFDTTVLNTHFYDPDIKSWDVPAEIAGITSYISASAALSNGSNPLWKHFGLTKRAKEATVTESPEQARMDLVMLDFNARMRRLQATMDKVLDSSRLPPGSRTLRGVILDDNFTDPGVAAPVAYEVVSVVVPRYAGSLARLLTDIGDAGIEVEDVHLVRGPGEAMGFVEISVMPTVAEPMRAELERLGWRELG